MEIYEIASTGIANRRDELERVYAIVSDELRSTLQNTKSDHIQINTLRDVLEMLKLEILEESK